MSTYRSSKRIPGWGDWLKAQLASAGMNQSELARDVGVSKSTVWRWVRDDQPKAQYVERIADVLVLDFDLVAEKAGVRPAMYETPPSEREARVMELARRIDWDRDEIPLRLAVSQLEELAEAYRKPARDQE